MYNILQILDAPGGDEPILQLLAVHLPDPSARPPPPAGPRAVPHQRAGVQGKGSGP